SGCSAPGASRRGPQRRWSSPCASRGARCSRCGRLGFFSDGRLRRVDNSEILVRVDMGHPTVDNATPFAVELLFLADEEGRPLLVPLVQATYDLIASRGLCLAEKQPPPSLTGERWSRDPAALSFRIEPAYAFIKPTTDIVLVGHAQDSRRRAAELDVVFRVGPVGKVLRVIGDRVWVRSAGAVAATKPLPFERVPLCYELAFGGWDRSDRDPARHTFEPKNPVGVGFRAPESVFEEGLRLPNIEDPSDLLLRYGQIVTPAGT